MRAYDHGPERRSRDQYLPCGPEQRTILKWLAGPLGIEPIGAALLRAS
jgi:hypothetical protein